jgi:hypothetical protein
MIWIGQNSALSVLSVFACQLSLIISLIFSSHLMHSAIHLMHSAIHFI